MFRKASVTYKEMLTFLCESAVNEIPLIYLSGDPKTRTYNRERYDSFGHNRFKPSHVMRELLAVSKRECTKACQTRMSG